MSSLLAGSRGSMPSGLPLDALTSSGLVWPHLPSGPA